jgi:predicted amidohydrolase
LEQAAAKGVRLVVFPETVRPRPIALLEPTRS